MLDHVWEGGSQEEHHQDVHLALIEPDKLWVFASAKCDSGPFPSNMGMDPARSHPPGQHLTKTYFKFDFKL